MSRVLLVGLLLFLSICENRAQQADLTSYGRNGVDAELYVIRPDFSDGFVSVNYERVLGKKLRSKLRIGMWPDLQSTVSFPITLSWITGPRRNHHFEYGIGSVFRIEHYVSDDPLQTKSWFYDVPALLIPIMYRYQKNSGLYFRGGINLFLSWPTLPSPSFSVGYKF